MDEAYFIGRMRASLEMAQNAAGSTARLIHFELAGRYSVAAVSHVFDHPRSWRKPFRPRELPSAATTNRALTLSGWLSE